MDSRPEQEGLSSGSVRDTGDRAPAALSRSLRALIAGVVLLPLLMLASVALLSWRQVRAEAEAEMVRASLVAAEFVRRVLDTHHVALLRAADLLHGLTDADVIAREAQLHAALRRMIGDTPELQTAYVVGREGHPLASASVFPVPRDADVSDREHHALLAVPGAPPVVVTRVYRGRIEDNLFFAIARRRDAGGSSDAFSGSINVTVEPVQFGAALRRLLVAPGDALALLRTDGEVLVRAAPGPLDRQPADSPVVQAMQRGEPVRVAAGPSAIDGVERIGVIRRIEGWPLYVSAARPLSAVCEAWRQNLILPVAVGLPATFALLGLALLVRRGKLRLALANAALGQRVAERTAQLAASEARLRRVQAIGRVGGFEIDLRTGRNERSAEYMGLQGLVPQRALENHEHWVRRLHPEDRDRAERHFLDAIGPASAAREYAQEYRIVTPTGETRWIAARAEIERDADGTALRVVGAHLDVTELKAAQSALQTGQARLETALRAAGLGTWDWDLRTDVSWWDARASAIYGFTPAEAPDAEAWRQHVHPEDRAGRAEAVAAAFAPDGSGTYATEYRFRRGDGTWIWITITGAVVERDPTTSAALRIAGVVQDVTERRTAERQRLRLMYEVDHRAKNALSLVLALMRLTPRDDACAYAETLQGRVSALARVHTLLADGAWESTDLAALVAGELGAIAPHAPDDTLRIAIDGPSLSITPVAAQAFSMMLHELAANALKHGALSTQAGTVAVRWRIRPRGVLKLEWQERGGPPVAGAPRRYGLGLAMVRSSAAEQLDGRAVLDWRPEGLCVTLTAPLAVLTGTPAGEPPASVVEVEGRMS